MRLLGKTLGSVALFLCICGNALSQEYVVATYQDDSPISPIAVKRIDLPSKSESEAVTLPFGGEIITKEPIDFRRSGSLYFLLIATDGQPCKNCQVWRPITRYAILDSSLAVARVDSVIDLGAMEYFENVRDSIILSFDQMVGNSLSVGELASFGISSRLDFRISHRFPSDYNPRRALRIDPFNYIRSLPNAGVRLYWDTDENFGLHFLTVDRPRQRIVESLFVGSILAYSRIFGFSNADSTLYVFSLSYDVPRDQRYVVDRNNAPSFLKKYSTPGLSLIDSIPLPNIAPDSDYVRNELGACNVEGPFMVYYFFASDDYRYFSPAMLFIFDTRTNEATWLRVGWR